VVEEKALLVLVTKQLLAQQILEEAAAVHIIFCQVVPEVRVW
jgi:hypothetical protein